VQLACVEERLLQSGAGEEFSLQVLARDWRESLPARRLVAGLRLRGIWHSKLQTLGSVHWQTPWIPGNKS